ncbi:GTP-binding protein 128up [Parasteatoda tepidariorum]|uniref:GTP-binding protein 128up n=1 Tax=Parasteatoda tepidariorum TaxID=114398 RepID=UPI0039BCA4FB
MASVVDKITAIEAEMARTQRNKATMGHLGLLKARLAKLKRELMTPKGGGGGPGEGFDVAKTGDARIGFVGFPSVGKSTLMNTLAGVFSEVAAYEFTTLTTVPGVIKYKGAKMQLLDLPGIIEGAKDGKGRGRQVIAVARTCSLIFIVLDVLKPLLHKKLIEHELEGFGIRLNKELPQMVLRKKDKGGINLQTMVKLYFFIFISFKISFTWKYTGLKDFTINTSLPLVIDCAENDFELDIIYQIPHTVPLSAHHKWNFDDLLEKTWEYLKLIRIYTKPKGQLPDYESPVILTHDRCTVEAFCNKLHRTIMKEFKYALVWGSSVKYNPQKVGKDHVLNDEDVVQVVKRV